MFEQETMSFGQLLKRFRKYHGFKQAEIAERFGYSEKTIKSWEQERRFPGYQEVERLAQLMEQAPETIKQAIQVGRIRENRLFHSRESQFLRTQGIFNEDYLRFLESELAVRWDAYRTGGSKLARQGLDSLLRITESAVFEARGGIWYQRANSALSLGYQLAGSICSDLTAYKQAHAFYKRACKIAEELQDHELMAATLARRGVAYIQHGNPNAAIACLAEASRLVDDLPTTHLKVYLFKALAEAYAVAHQGKESLQAIDLAEKIMNAPTGYSERTYCRVNTASIQAQKGVNAVLLGEYSEAVTLIDSSLKTYNHAYIRGRARLVVQKAEAYYGLKDVVACIGLAEEAYTLATAVGSGKTLERLRQLHRILARQRKDSRVERLGALLAMR